MNTIRQTILDNIDPDKKYTGWVGICARMPLDMNRADAFLELQKMEEQGLVWTATLTRKIRHQAQSQTSLIVSKTKP